MVEKQLDLRWVDDVQKKKKGEEWWHEGHGSGSETQGKER